MLSWLLVVVPSLAYYVKLFDEPFANLDNWTLETIDGQQTGNSEWQHYTDRSSNVFVRKNENGNSMVLRAVAEEYQGYHYTSGRVHSKKAFGPYGFFNFYAKVPKGEALWPAIWLLPTYKSPYGTWAACGEIDIMETVCSNNDGFSTLHFGQPWPKNVQYPDSGNNKYPSAPDWNHPHWFGVDWQPDFMTFYLDAQVVNGVISGTVISKISSSHWWSANEQGHSYGQGAPFNQPFNIILNLAVGGNWPCGVGCCKSAAVPAELEVFKAQVWEKA
jgi:beta-glucanase (GH16 family)